jgi:spermidine dehydrogenase
MALHRRDKALGMGRPITRRDFLNGVALTVATPLVAPRALLGLGIGDDFAPEKSPGYYPPALTGLRGSHPGSFEAAHDLKDGFFEMKAPLDTREEYDLVVVGAGISGLSAAHFFRKLAGPTARVLILDNHDDFGGHARRNEFEDGGRLYVTNGGTLSIDSPGPYSAVAKGLISELGIDVGRWEKVLDREVYAGLAGATFFDKETFGEDKLVKGLGGGFGERRSPDPAALEQVPLPEPVRRDILKLETESLDPWLGVASAEKKARLLKLSYGDFLTTVLKLDPRILPYYQTRGHGLFGVGIDAISALDGWGLGFPGFDGLRLEPGAVRGMNRDAVRSEEAEDYFFHYPDGNATVARLLVRRLIPAAVPGQTADDAVMARADYGRLDEAGSPVRLRLNSTVVKATNLGKGAADARGVEVTYLRGGNLRTVRGRSCVMACWNAVIPHLCPEMPEAQRDALGFAVKVPLVYTSVFVRNWKVWKALGIRSATCPGAYYGSVRLDVPVNVGDYACARDPEGPIVVTLHKALCSPGLPARDQHKAGRQELLDSPFEEMERRTRDQMARVLGPGGFDPARDIKAITINRWPHGYSYQYNGLFDPFWVAGGEPPCVTARKPFGRIFIANSDADAYAYTDCAIDQAHRAVGEALAGKN